MTINELNRKLQELNEKTMIAPVAFRNQILNEMIRVKAELSKRTNQLDT